MTDIISKTKKIGFCDIHYLEAGNTKDQTVILLHGMKFQAATWQDLGTLEQLTNAGFHAIAIDMPGFGKSPACEIDRNTVLSQFIEETGKNTVLAGPSMGGRIALEFTLKNQNDLNGLVLIGSVGVQENKDELHTINIPTLIIWGSEDQISPLENCELLHSSIAGAKKIIIDGAPHPCYLDNSEIWHRKLLNFLKAID